MKLKSRRRPGSASALKIAARSSAEALSSRACKTGAQQGVTRGAISVGPLGIELALLHRAYHLAVKKKRVSARTLPDIELPPPDHAAVRKGFFRRVTIERLCERLPSTIADVVLFLFFCPWRIGAAQRLEWRGSRPPDPDATPRPPVHQTSDRART